MAPSALKSSMCLKVFSTWSSPRITCVTRWSMSSTTLARWKIGEPSERTIAKSGTSSAFFSMWPFTMSSNAITPSLGMRNITTSPVLPSREVFSIL